MNPAREEAPGQIPCADMQQSKSGSESEESLESLPADKVRRPMPE